MISAYGNMPGEFMGMVFQLLTPMKSLTKYNIDLIDIAHDEKKLMNFLRMEKWLSDRPDHPGEAAKQWFKELYQDNKLIKNEFELDGQLVDLTKIQLPILNIYAQNDHIIPPSCSKALGDHVASEDYTNLPLPGGHVGVFVSGKSQGILGENITNWLKVRGLLVFHQRAKALFLALYLIDYDRSVVKPCFLINPTMNNSAKTNIILNLVINKRFKACNDLDYLSTLMASLEA